VAFRVSSSVIQNPTADTHALNDVLVTLVCDAGYSTGVNAALVRVRTLARKRNTRESTECILDFDGFDREKVALGGTCVVELFQRTRRREGAESSLDVVFRARYIQ
jgi:hypothetical protein